MKGLSALCLSLLVALLVGCGAQPEEGRDSTSSAGGIPGREKEPGAARVVCDGGGLHVLTPEVAARPDGVHLAVDNRLEGPRIFR